MAKLGLRAFAFVVGVGIFAVGRPLAADGGASPDFVARARAHYAQVERELASADVSALDPARRAARTRAIESLAAYRGRGDFGVNTDYPGARVPYFVDDAGRRCAVAELLHCAGEDDVVSRVARTANHAWIADLEGDAELRSWLDRSGLTVEEAARIQVPGSMEAMDAWNAWKAAQTPPYIGGTDDAAGGPASPEGTGVGASGGTHPAGGAKTDGPIDLGARGAAKASGADVSSWRIWWELSKLDFVSIRPLRFTTTGRTDNAVKHGLEKFRADGATVFAAALADKDAAVRAAAATALARTTGEDAVAQILPLLDDADRLVRDRTILALGATASPAAAKKLVEVVRSADAPAETRALALVALGLARRAGLDASLDVDVAKTLEATKKKDLADVGPAAFIHDLLAGAESLDAAAVRTAENSAAPDTVRGRAVESLGRRRNDKAAAAALRRVVGDKRVDVRRSAAVALGDSFDPMSLAQATTAYEMESEPLTRGFLLLSLGRVGAAKERDVLKKELAQGPDALRPWAALGLGLYARRGGDDEAKAALRDAVVPAAAKNALRLAQGLARDVASLPALGATLMDSPSQEDRAYAATALALTGEEDARFMLLKAAKAEKSESVRVVVAWGLGAVGRDVDARDLVAVVDSVRDPGAAGVLAVALGMHGSDICLEGAMRDASSESAASRAAGIEAAGLMLSKSHGLVLHEVSVRTNFAVMPRWLRSALGSTL